MQRFSFIVSSRAAFSHRGRVYRDIPCQRPWSGPRYQRLYVYVYVCVCACSLLVWTERSRIHVTSNIGRWELWEVGTCSQNLYETAPKKFQKSSLVRVAAVMQVKTIDIINSYRLLFTLYNFGNRVKLTQLNEWVVNKLHGTEPSLTNWQYRSYYTYSSVNGTKPAAIWSEEHSISHCPVITWLAAIYSRAATRFLS